jgi:Flp pilus assembly secretin CpaC
MNRLGISACVIGLFVWQSTAYAQQLNVFIGNATIFNVGVTPAQDGLIVGDPTILKVEIHGRRIVLRGMRQGKTSFNLRDKDDAQIASFDITVSDPEADLVVFTDKDETHYICTNSCTELVDVKSSN